MAQAEDSQLVWRSAKAGPPAGLAPCAAARGVYSREFTAYLARFLLAYDPATKGWWESQRPGARADLVARFEASLEDGLARNVCDHSDNEDSSNGNNRAVSTASTTAAAATADLCAGLAARFGLWVPALTLQQPPPPQQQRTDGGVGGGEEEARRKAEAENAFVKSVTVNLHLALLFGLLDDSDRPKALIDALFASPPLVASGSARGGGGGDGGSGPRRVGGGGGGGGGVEWWQDPAALYPVRQWPESLVTDQGQSTASSGGSGVSDSRRREQKRWLESNVASLKRDLSTAERGSAAATATTGRTSLETPGPSSSAPVAAASAGAAAGAAAASGNTAAAALAVTREAPIGLREYALFGVAGMLGCTATHAVVVPLDGGENKRIGTQTLERTPFPLFLHSYFCCLHPLSYLFFYFRSSFSRRCPHNSTPTPPNPPLGRRVWSVVKTRKQVQPLVFADLSLLEGAKRIADTEGPQNLYLGLFPTMAGYAWYGLTVYPGYEFLKRFFLGALSDPALGWVNPATGLLPESVKVPVVLVAGSLATCVACLGVCPAEAVRIRCVDRVPGVSAATTSNSDKGAGGEEGALKTLNQMVRDGGWPSLWKGLPPLLVRQIIFGMLKFLVFDYFPQALYSTFPLLKQLADLSATDATATATAATAASTASFFPPAAADTAVDSLTTALSSGPSFDLAAAGFAALPLTPPELDLPSAALLALAPWVPLLVSLASGLVAGVVATAFSQPGDAILTRMAQDDRCNGVAEAAQALWRGDEQDKASGGRGGGLAPFFVGVGPRSVWAGCVIGGQFFLYDVFRAAAHVSPQDLTQVLDVFGTVDILLKSDGAIGLLGLEGV